MAAKTAEELNDLSNRIIGIAIDIHKKLGPGFQEKIYEEALLKAYLAGGDKAFPKERIELFGGGKIAVIDDFKKVITCENGKIKKIRFTGQDKGHQKEIETFAKALTDGESSPIPWDEIYTTTLASILAVRSIREGIPFDLSTADNLSGGQSL